MQCAVVLNGVVINTIMADPVNDPAPSGTTLVKIPDGVFVEIGYTYDGQNFAPPTN